MAGVEFIAFAAHLAASQTHPVVTFATELEPTECLLIASINVDSSKSSRARDNRDKPSHLGVICRALLASLCSASQTMEQ
jgi:hypothetical protein